MENPELLLGIPFLLLAALGLFIAFSLFALPAEEGAGGRAITRAHGHPEPADYVIIGLALALITLIEVALYYVDLNFSLMVVILIVLSALKFMLVVGFFMHLRFDSRLYSILFFGGLGLAVALFTVVIATLEAGLV